MVPFEKLLSLQDLATYQTRLFCIAVCNWLHESLVCIKKECSAVKLSDKIGVQSIICVCPQHVR